MRYAIALGGRFLIEQLTNQVILQHSIELPLYHFLHCSSHGSAEGGDWHLNSSRIGR